MDGLGGFHHTMNEFRPPPLLQFREMQPISILCSLCSNRASLQPLNRPAALCWPEKQKGDSTNSFPLNYTKTFPTKTIQRMDPIRRRESVCRSLFGPVDHDQLCRELKLKLKEITEQDSRRWNFNFQTEMPLPGRFQWEEIPASCAASFYREFTPLKDDACTSNTEDGDRLSSREESSGTDQENCSRISNTTKCPAEVTPVRRKRTLSKPAAKPRNSTRITGEEQVGQIHNEPVSSPCVHAYYVIMKKTKKWVITMFSFVFLGRFFRKEEEDDRKQEHPEPLSHKLQWRSPVQNNTMTTLWKTELNSVSTNIVMDWTEA